MLVSGKGTLLGTKISHPKAVGKMSFLSHWWDMLVPWRVRVMTWSSFLFLRQADPIQNPPAIPGEVRCEFGTTKNRTSGDVEGFKYLLKRCLDVYGVYVFASLLLTTMDYDYHPRT